MYLATKYASLVLGVKIDTLKKSAQRGNNYPFIKYQNKLLFKVSQAQLSIALHKGLIDVNTPIFNDDLTPNQDLANSRRTNGKTNSKSARAVRQAQSGTKQWENNYGGDGGDSLRVRERDGISASYDYGYVEDNSGQGELNAKFIRQACERAKNGNVFSETIGCDSSSHDRDCDKECANYFGCTTKGAKRRRRKASSGSVYATSSANATTIAYRDDRNDNDTWCRQTFSITTSFKEDKRDNDRICEKQGAVDDNTTNYNANNQCDNKSLLSNENEKNEIKDSITSARFNKTMSQKYKNETTNSEIYEQINKPRIKNVDNHKNKGDIRNNALNEAKNARDRETRTRVPDDSKSVDTGCVGRGQNQRIKCTSQSTSTPLSTKNRLKSNTSSKASNTNEQSTLNECLNERESFLLENNLSHTHASLSTFLKANAKSQEIALARVHVVKEYLKLKGKIKVSEFIDLINARGILKLSQRKLFLWQKAYLSGGLDALIPQYKNTKKTTLEELDLKEFFENALISEKGRINLANVYKLVHYEASARNLISLDDFLAKKDELVSYASIKRAANAFFKNNKLLKDLILYGEDGCTSRHLPALGVSNWAVNSINQIVEIDASPLDAICNTTDIATRLGIDEQLVSSWQKRYCIISLIDTYSGVVSFYLGESENSQTIARAIAKYIKLYGKPKCIHSDNGKAFLSKHIKGMLERLDIEYKAMPAYSGWCKPYVENKFKALQNSLTANLSGYIGANVGQRQAIEFFMSKKERRLKKGMKTNLAKLKDLEYMQNIIDDFTNKFLNNTFLDRLQSTPNEAYMKKQDEAICIDELSLSMYLGGSLEYRNVSSKGISLNGQIYQNPKLYNYESVYVCASLNNVSQIFCFDEQKELICVAVLIDPVVGVSVQEAKLARKLYVKALKQNKEKISKARDERERMFERYIELGKETLNSITPNPTYTNDRLLEELEYANMLVAGSDVSVKKSNVKSWEDFV